MSHYKPYPAYRDSEVEWIGEVPEHWKRAYIKHILSAPITDGPHETPKFAAEGIEFLSVDGIQDGELVFDGKRFISEGDHIRFSKKSKPQLNDVLVGKSASVGKVARVKTCAEFNVWSPLAILRSDPEKCHPAYLEYALKADTAQQQILLAGNTSTQANIGMDRLATIGIPLPPLEEQYTIVTGVDRETVRIDALIAKKTRFIELLKEKRQALITHAVTKGLDPKVKLKDSEVEWIGYVPEHWIVGRLSDFCTSISTGPFGTALGVSDYIEGGIPVINPSHMNEGVCSPDELITVSEATAQRLAYWLLHEGDIVAARRGELGRAAIVTSKEAGWICGTGSLRLTPLLTRATPTYLYSVLQSGYARAWLDRESVGSTMPNLNESLIGRLPVVIPPSTKEQTALLTSLHLQEQRVATLTAKTQHSIDLLKERRSAFITAAVTGKIDLRNIDIAKEHP